MIGLVDGNNFYVSCERIFDPTLEGRPVAVLSNNDGCVISRSYEFKALDIPMGTPYFKLRDQEKRYGIIFRSSNYELYGDISRRVIETLSRFALQVEQYSIDEAFIHVNIQGGSDALLDYAKMIRKTVLQWVGIPCGVGFAQTKTLAKIANHIAKKTSDGVFIMPADNSQILHELPVEEVWGVGRRTAEGLNRIGIRTALQLAATDENRLRKAYGVTLARTAQELRGKQAIGFENYGETASNSISCTRSFGSPVTEITAIEEAASYYLSRAAEKLRKQHLRAAGANIFLQHYPEEHLSDEARRLWSYSGGITSATVAFDMATAATSLMLKAVQPKIRGLFVNGRRYKKAGIILYGFEPEDQRQGDLFISTEKNDRLEKASKAMDAINRKFGKGKIFTLSEGIERPWAMKREMLSPCYTTKWDSIPTVR
jgi:DNA polymerase V